jgi:hypothetical protein
MLFNLLIGFLSALAFAAGALAAAPKVKSSDLIKAAKAATVSAVDDRRKECNDKRTIAQWLKQAVGDAARSVAWSGGACKLVDERNPRDAGTKWCALATIAPKKGGPSARIEIFFEAPKGGRPGKAFAFRAEVHTNAGPDYMRETSAFEANWGETYNADYKPPENADCK